MCIFTQGDHRGCHPESRCRLPGYVPKRKLLSDSAAIRALEEALRRTSIFRYAAHYCRVKLLLILRCDILSLLIYSAGIHIG